VAAIAVEGFVEVGLLNADGGPIGVELLGDHHGEHGLDTLADLGGLGHEGDDAVGSDLNKGAGREVGARRALREGEGRIEEA
jgi:hypothetical protein